jgi:hypothetical protein
VITRGCRLDDPRSWSQLDQRLIVRRSCLHISMLLCGRQHLNRAQRGVRRLVPNSRVPCDGSTSVLGHERRLTAVTEGAVGLGVDFWLRGCQHHPERLQQSGRGHRREQGNQREEDLQRRNEGPPPEDEARLVAHRDILSSDAAAQKSTVTYSCITPEASQSSTHIWWSLGVPNDLR